MASDLTPPESPPAARLVLLGASNVTLGLAHAIEAAKLRLGGPLEILAAHGFGRSYGAFSCVLGRGLPGVSRCGLWEALKLAPPRPTFAVVTDVGNDIVYGAAVETIVEWVRRCVRELRGVDARIVVTLPAAHLEGIGRPRYLAFRTLLYPTRPLRFEAMKTRVGALREGLKAVAGELGASTLSPSSTWFGVDPLHIRRRYRAAAWGEIASNWGETPAIVDDFRPGLWRELRLPIARPLSWSLLGVRLGSPQPNVRLRDGSTIALY